MDATEALEWAADYAQRNGIFDAPKNDRGYVRDGWKEPTPEQRVEVITVLAKQVMEKPVSYHLTLVKNTLSNCIDQLSDAKSLDPWRYDPRTVSEVELSLANLLKELG